MKLLISQMNEGENPFHFSSTKDAWMRQLTGALLDRGYEVPGEMKADLKLTKLEPDYYLRGKLEYGVKQTCARCAEAFVLPIQHGFDIALAHISNGSSPKHRGLKSEESAELDIQFFEGNEINLASLLEEQFFLGIPFQALCQVDCKGVCQHCGKNLNLTPDCGCTRTGKASPFAVLKDHKLEGK